MVLKESSKSDKEENLGSSRAIMALAWPWCSGEQTHFFIVLAEFLMKPTIVCRPRICVLDQYVTFSDWTHQMRCPKSFLSAGPPDSRDQTEIPPELSWRVSTWNSRILIGPSGFQRKHSEAVLDFVPPCERLILRWFYSVCIFWGLEIKSHNTLEGNVHYKVMRQWFF